MTEATITREQVEANIQEAQAKLDEARSAFATYMSEAGTSADTRKTMELAQAAVKAEEAVNRAKRQLEDIESNERWQKLASVNRGINQAMEAAVKAGIPTPEATELIGTVTIDANGEHKVDVRIVREPENFGDLKAAVIKHVNANLESYKNENVDGLTFKARLTGEGAPSFSVLPKGAGSTRAPKAASSGGNDGSRGRKLYIYNGAELSGREFLQAVRPQWEDAHRAALNRALDIDGNGLSNLADTIANKMDVTIVRSS